MDQYINWVNNPTKENLSILLDALDPAITSEVYRYSGPKNLLRGRARVLAINAIRSYNPASGAKLRSWVVTQLQPLSRYSKQLVPVYIPEVSMRQASELNATREQLKNEFGRDPTDMELSDETGLSEFKVKKLRSKVNASIYRDATEELVDESSYAPATTSLDSLDLSSNMVYNSLQPDDKKIYELKTGLMAKAVPNKDIAKRLGVTPAFISQRSKDIANKILDAQKYV